GMIDLYRTVLIEAATPEDLYAYLDTGTLQRLWSYLWLPSRLADGMGGTLPASCGVEPTGLGSTVDQPTGRHATVVSRACPGGRRPWWRRGRRVPAGRRPSRCAAPRRRRPGCAPRAGRHCGRRRSRP